MARLDGAIHQSVVIRGLKLIAFAFQEGRQFPTGRKLELDLHRPLALTGQVEKDHRQVQEGMIAIQHAVKGAVRVGINRVVEGEVAARPVRSAPGVQILAVQISGLAITIAFHVFHVFHEVADLVKAVPGGNLNLRARARVRNVQRDLYQVRFRRAQIHHIMNRLSRLGGPRD